MPVRPILMWPDPRLSQVAQPVTAFDEALLALAADLTDTIRSTSGVGIAGPHIGALSRIFVLELTRGEPVVYVNPVLVSASGVTGRHMEGSISMPGLLDEVDRPDQVTVEYRTLTGEKATETATGFRATCLQHEIDQLDGLFWIFRLSKLKRDRLVKKYEKMKGRGMTAPVSGT